MSVSLVQVRSRLVNCGKSDLSVALPLRSADDPTGLKVYGQGEWTARQHGASRRRSWRKLNLGINTDSQEIVAQQMTEAYGDDARQLKPLLAQIDTPVARCYGDEAYDRWHVHRLLAYPPANHPAPIEAVIPPCENAQPRESKLRYRHIEARMYLHKE